MLLHAKFNCLWDRTKELESLGFTSPFWSVEEGGGAKDTDAVGLVNTTWELVQSYRSCVKTITDLEAKLQRVHCDAERAVERAGRARDQLEARQEGVH